MIDSLLPYKTIVEQELKQLSLPIGPLDLYDPLRYFLKIGGKRMRPILALLSCELFSGEKDQAIHAAIAIELFHNFSLIHDDIMDKAPLRRGMTTVHEKWNLNIGILSGDALLIESYKQLESYDSSVFKKLMKVFNKTAIEVCEGQQFDMDFETQQDVSIDQYINMIRLKTAVLLGCSLKMGAIIANASVDDQNRIYDFGVNLGISFQIQDDYLDAFGSSAKVGKQLGGDIITNKKTYLLLTAFQDANSTQKAALTNALTLADSNEKVQTVLALFNALKIKEKTADRMEHYHTLALENLAGINTSDETKKSLSSLAKFLLSREF